MGANRKFPYTDDDVREAIENGIHRKAFIQRLSRGMSIEEAKTKPMYKRNEYDPLLVEKAIANDIPPHVFYQRKRNGWGDERATTEPVHKASEPEPRPKREPMGKPGRQPIHVETDMEDWEVIACVARIKYMNLTQTMDYPITVPKPLRKRLEAMNMTMDKIIPMEVDDNA